MSALSEIRSIPVYAKTFVGNTKSYSLPTKVPYVGMGSSYFAALAFKYMGVKIYPELASEFFNYIYDGKKMGNAVLLSQSGKSSEVLWCTSCFDQYTAISNDVNSPLCQASNLDNMILLLADEEKFSSSKTYINTLLALFKGFGFDVQRSVELLNRNFESYELVGKKMANEIFERLQSGSVNGLYITGNGANVATAMQAGLIMSEMTKLNFHGLPMAQYDHGPKETAENSVVIQIVSKGKSFDRSMRLAEVIRTAGATVLNVEEPHATENESIIHNIVPFNFMGYYLSRLLKVQDTFIVGGKITEVGN